MAKGGEYERQFCKRLSMWWTEGERDDVFWRSQQSGGRATVRARKGIATKGQYGDVAATDPIGQPLIDFMPIELKRGYDDAYPWKMWDSSTTRRSKKPSLFEQFLEQAMRAKSQSGAKSWALVINRDRREEIIYLQPTLFHHVVQLIGGAEYVRFRMKSEYFGKTISVCGLQLESFYRLDPKSLICNE